MGYFKSNYTEPKYLTASSLASRFPKTHESGYRPMAQSVKKVLEKYSIPSKKMYGADMYDTKNAKRCLEMHIAELRYFDDQFNKEQSVNNNKFIPRKHGETDAHRELDRETLYEENMKLNEKQIRKVLEESFKTILSERILGAGESFTEYSPEEKEKNFEYLRTGNGRSLEDRNPSYAAAKKAAAERLARRKAGLDENNIDGMPDKVNDGIMRQVSIEEENKSGIEIDPKNKGKFTKTKKETGKSTEELCHSKNPLTRKRANLARMAKRHFKPLEEGEENILTNIEDDMFNDSVDFARKQEEVRAKAINILKNMGYSGFIANRQNSCALKFPVNGLQDRNQIYNALYNGLGVTSEYDLTVKVDSNLNGTVFYCKVNLPTWNKLNGNSINESILEKVITESIKEILSEDHLKVVDNIPEMESYIHDTWNSPNDVWWVKIEARKKDYKNYNIRNKGQKPTKWWKRVGGPDSTDRENHVGYVIVRGANAEAAVNSMKNAVVHLNPWAADIAGTDKVYSNGNCEAIKTVCHQFFARAYITVNPRKMDATVQKARDDKKSGLFKGREFHHRVGQARTGVDSSGFNWSIDRPNGLVDCDVDDAQGQKWLEDYFSQQGVEIKLRKPSHDGMHYIISIDDAKKCDFKYILKNMSQYDTNNRKGDPSVLFKPDANIILYSAVG